MSRGFSSTFAIDAPSTACDALARLTGLPKGRVKDCMTKGGVWWSRPGRATARLRRATSAVQPGERLEINYDPELLALSPARPEAVFECRRYSVWDKPAGVLSQGTRFADHCAMPRLVQARLGLRDEPHPVHRLDREARGLILLAHDGKAAAKLGEMFRQGRIGKEYMVIVRGEPDWAELAVDTPLDGRACTSAFTVLQTDGDVSLISARIGTGRRHQIRRHLAGLGHPVLGDPRYGRGHACPAGLQLLARSLAFTCPFTGSSREWSLPPLPFPPER
jgi:tRNA pseudouridine32 synthase/23S rRNA pseudouridine746 synthase